MNDVESTWIEIDQNNSNKHMIIGCIYKHPNADISQFTVKMENILKMLNQRKYEVYLMGDINIDFLNYTAHAPTEEYLDMLYSNDFLPLITKPTRITNHTKTLIDHIYTNAINVFNATPGIATIDISDHLPVFCVFNKQLTIGPKMNPL